MRARDRQALAKRIEKFLSKHKESAGGWPEVTFEEIAALHDIVARLIVAKYEADPDGDRPIQVYLRDCTREERLPFMSIPLFPRQDKLTEEQYVASLREREKALAINVRVAGEALEQHYRLRDLCPRRGS